MSNFYPEYIVLSWGRFDWVYNGRGGVLVFVGMEVVVDRYIDCVVVRHIYRLFRFKKLGLRNCCVYG